MRQKAARKFFLKCQVSYIAKQGANPTVLNSLYGPISPVPKTLVEKHGVLYKTSKIVTYATGYLEKRYKDVPIVTANFPSQ